MSLLLIFDKLIDVVDLLASFKIQRLERELEIILAQMLLVLTNGPHPLQKPNYNIILYSDVLPQLLVGL